MLPDYDGAFRLLAAVVRQWLVDAGQDAEALAEIANWLDITPRELRRRMTQQPALATYASGRTCPACGQALPLHNAGASGRGRRRLWCSDRCRRRAAELLRDTNHAAK